MRSPGKLRIIAPFPVADFIMFSHTSLGTNDLEKAETFYEAILPALGGKKFFSNERTVFWEFAETQTKFSVFLPFNGEPATVGNGSMVAFSMKTNEDIDNLHAQALSLGATSDGDPGERGEGQYYAAYFRDLDGNKIGIFVMQQTEAD